MKKHIILTIITIFFCVFTAKAKENKNILLINSYHYGYYWTDELTKGVENTLKQRENTTIFIEYLDAKRNPTYYKSNEYKNAFLHKYKDKEFDIVISSDNAALNFCLKQKGIPNFKDASFIATGITNYKKYANTPNLYLIPEQSTSQQTLKYIFQFFPNTQELIFVSDTLPTAQINIRIIKDTFEQKYPDVKFTILHEFTLQTLPEIIKQYNPPTVIYSGNVSIDKNGNPVDEFDVARIIKENANTAIFSGLYCERFEGFMGGVYTAGYENGQVGGQVALMIINDNPNLEKITFPPVKTVFDHHELKKFNISKKIVPSDANILNQPISYFEKNKNVLIINGIIILNLLIVIAFFVYLWLTQKKHKEQLVKAVSQAQEANKLKTVFLENVSHEMRTPLNSIIGFSDVLSEMITKPTEKQYLKIISDNALDLYNLISNIFNFSLLKSHKVSLNYSEVSPSQLIEEILTETYLKQKIEEESINLDLDYEQNEISIISDREKLFQVLKSTIDNAFKFTQEGTVTIKFRLTHNKSLNFNGANENTNEKASHILFKIKDTGKGITPEELEYIFEPFRQADEKDTNANRGLGLGLSISKSIIEIMGGRLHIKSKPGKGTKIHFSIPVKSVKSNQTIGS